MSSPTSDYVGTFIAGLLHYLPNQDDLTRASLKLVVSLRVVTS